MTESVDVAVAPEVDPSALRNHLRETWPDCDLIVRISGVWTVFALPDGAEADAATQVRDWLTAQGHTDPDQEIAERINAASTLDELKAALVGEDGGVRVPGRRPMS